jgi:hypothetical protein
MHSITVAGAQDSPCAHPFHKEVLKALKDVLEINSNELLPFLFTLGVSLILAAT